MRVVIMAVGSFGDVAPYTGLAAALGRAGHRVAIATHEPYASAVTGADLDFLRLPMDPRAMLAGDQGRRAGSGSPWALRHSIAMVAEHQRDLGRGMVAAALGADLLLLSPLAWLGWHVAEGLGIRSAGAYLQPWTPTREFPPAAMTTRSLGPWGNQAAARVLRMAGQRPARRVVDDLRAELGLPRMSSAASFAAMEARRWPILYGFSPAVVPAPSDWPAWHPVVGYWWPTTDPRWTPPTELEDFLADGPPPVVLGFGSMHLDDPVAFGGLLSEAVRSAGVRAVVQSSDGRLRVRGADVLTIGSAPHAWLFPRSAAVVHHCGAGTAAAGLRAGVPTVPVPVMLDQPFWARRLHMLGVSTAPLVFRRLAAGPLAERLVTAVGDATMRSRALDLAAAITAEDGAARAVALLEA